MGGNRLTALFPFVNSSASPGEAVAGHLLNLLILFVHPSRLPELLYPVFWNNIPIGE